MTTGRITTLSFALVSLLSMWQQHPYLSRLTSYPESSDDWMPAPNDSNEPDSNDDSPSSTQDWPLIHVVTTRFMQHQPDLIELGKARLALFEAICLPTMVQQTVGASFLWMIKTDPLLDAELELSLKTLIAPYPNFYLVHSNDNDLHDLSSINVDSISSGALELLKQVTAHQNEKMLLETRLDADDGLYLGYLEYIQRHVLSPNKQPQVTILCIDKHLEWHPHSNALEPARKGHCITPGLSFAKPPNTPHLPRIPHHILHQRLPPCSSDGMNLTSTPICLHRLEDIEHAAAIRGRTITSAGMADVLDGGGNDADPFTATEIQLMWNVVEQDFGLSAVHMNTTQNLLHQSMALIAHENLQGQCTKGHSCKNSSKEKLQQLLNGTSTA